jgi:hypothetical protein
MKLVDDSQLVGMCPHSFWGLNNSCSCALPNDRPAVPLLAEERQKRQEEEKAAKEAAAGEEARRARLAALIFFNQRLSSEQTFALSLYHCIS